MSTPAPHPQTLPVAAPPRVAAWLRAAPDGPARVLHACADAVHLEVAGRCVSLVGPHGPGLPVALRSKVPRDVVIATRDGLS